MAKEEVAIKDNGFELLLKQISKESPDMILDGLMCAIDKEKGKSQWVIAAYIALLKKLGY